MASSSHYHEELQIVESDLATIEVDLQVLLERQSELLDKRAELKAVIDQHATSGKQLKDEAFWSTSDFEWSADIDEKLKSVFHLKELRPMQRQSMNATLSGEDSLLIMPTGGGKSLCFQLPAVIKKGLTLVVSPLISLIEDQQMALEQLNIPAAVLNASSSKDEQKFVLDDIVNVNGSLRLLYVTPEKLAKSKRFMNKLEKSYAIGHLSRLVIDEVHCCSQWGHDFRPDYKFLGIMKRQFPNVPILGLTATATTKVMEDVKKILNIPNALVLKASFNRPNLFYEVRQKPATQKETVEAIHDLIGGKYRNQSGIVYCFSRNDSHELAASLQSLGVKAHCYHGDMDAKARSRVHRRWLTNDIHVVVATIAFGMGIDKPDVRFVIHHSISKSMENLYQESGRAGRDSNKADCIVFFRLADFIRQSCMVFTEQTGLTNLHSILKYCTDVSSCRRALIAQHFGEVWHSSQCSEMCDHCKHAKNREKRDVTRHCTDLLVLLDAAASANQRVTAIKLVDAWYGKGPPALKVKSVAAPSMPREAAERILAHALISEFVREDFHFTAYSTICYLVSASGHKARLLRNKSVKVSLEYVVKTPNKSGASTLVSSSSTSSSSPSSKSSSLPSPLKKAKSADLVVEKPKLVVINKGKSHFNSLGFPSSSPSSSGDSVPQLKKSSSSKAKPSQKKTFQSRDASTSNDGGANFLDKKKKQQGKTDDDEGLSFDDDVPFDRKRNARSRKEKLHKSDSKMAVSVDAKANTDDGHNTNYDKGVTANSNSSPDSHRLCDAAVTSASTETPNERANKHQKLTTKRKRIVISSDSSDDGIDNDDGVSVLKRSRAGLDHDVAGVDNGNHDSVVVSDDDDDLLCEVLC